VSAQDVDILEAVGGGVAYGHAPTEDDVSEASEGSLGYGKDDYLGNSDDDSAGAGAEATGEEGAWRTQHRRSSATTNASTRRRTSSAGTGAEISHVDYRRASTPHNEGNNKLAEISHTIEVATQFCPLPVTDILFSTTGGFIAIVYIRKVLVVFNNQTGIKKMSLKISFDEVFCDVRAMVPTDVSATSGAEPNAQRSEQDDEFDLPQSDTHKRVSEAALTFTDRSGHRRASLMAPTPTTTAQTHSAPQLGNNDTTTSAPVIPEDDSLVLLLQSPTRVRLLDGIKGVILTEFPLQVPADHASKSRPTAEPSSGVAACAAWDVPILGDTGPASSNTLVSTERAVAGLCVAEGMRVFTFGEESGRFQQHYLNDQTPPAALAAEAQFTASLHTESLVDDEFQTKFPPGRSNPIISRTQVRLQTLPRDAPAAQDMRNPPLDNLIQGMCVRELSGFSPLVCVWSMRRLVLLRVQLVRNCEVEVLRTEEYCVSQEHVRIVYASPLKTVPRMRNHRAMVVLSNGHVVVLHI
jgi:hypothetical protein